MACGQCGTPNVTGLCRDCARDRYRDEEILPADGDDEDGESA
jgi:NMD protein affecting ribosome stability and mRNA decay